MKHLKKSFIILFALILILATGCSKSKKEDNTEERKSTEASKENLDEITLDGMASDVLKTMSLEEKIGQLFIVCTDSMDFDGVTEVTETMRQNFERYQPGGMILFSINMKNPDQTRSFIADMQSSVKIPMFMGVDEEGGRVARIANNENMGTTQFPSMRMIGDSGDLDMAAEVGSTIGKEIHALGFNLDFAPVVDVMNNETNMEIGDRSFGNDPELVSSMAVKVLKGLQRENVCATLKHFPGQGSSTEDTHKGYVNLEASIDQLRKVDFLPFEAGIKADTDFIMVSHVSVGNVTGNDVPATLSNIVVKQILRNELKYENIIITDAMNMKSITKFYDPDEAAVKAFLAGNDMILMPDDFEQAVEGIQEAVESGKIEKKDINDAVKRILKIKIKRGIIPSDAEFFSK
ncbi:MAG: glycoside hydrolase family 3 protein [Eubacteriales bacterium]|nr:glycoside hydrolase family 3 protein [Eubacteriales bacterium]